MIVVFFIISFLLDGIIFSLSSINSVAAPLFSMLCLVIAYPYCSDNLKKLYISSIVIGIFYDIVYTNSLFLNTLLYVGVVYLIDKIFRTFTNNIVNTCLVSALVVCLYRFITYSFYWVIGIINWDIMDIISSLSHSIIINFVYILIFYYILLFISKKLKIRRIF